MREKTPKWKEIFINTTETRDEYNLELTAEQADYIRLQHEKAMDAVWDNHYNSVVLLFQGAGFRNVSAVPLHDLTILNVGRNGKVDTVTINGSSEFEEGDVFPRDSKVLIPYHSR